MDQHFISIIVPFYNAERTLGACLEALSVQTYPSDRYEIIAINNKSTDTSLAIARQFQHIIVLEENSIQSPGAARNMGIKEARGEFIAFTDADCVPDKRWLEFLISSFDQDPLLLGVGGEVKPYQPKTIVQLYQAHQNILSPKYLAATKFGILPPTCNMMFKAFVFKTVGYFNFNLISREDTDLVFRILDQIPGKIIFNWSAVVFHQHRTGMRELWLQYYRYGIGRRQWKDLGHSLSFEKLKIESFFIYILVGFFISWGKTILICINYLRGVSPNYEILFPWLEWWEGMALRQGFESAENFK